MNRILLTTLVGITLLKQSLLPSARADLPQGRLRGPVDDHHRRARPRRARSPGPPPRARRTRRPACRIPGRHPRSAPQGLLRSHRGGDGGWTLARPADSITIADVIRALDGPLASVGGAAPSSPNRADVNRSPPCGSRCAYPIRSRAHHDRRPRGRSLAHPDRERRRRPGFMGSARTPVTQRRSVQSGDVRPHGTTHV